MVMAHDNPQERGTDRHWRAPLDKLRANTDPLWKAGRLRMRHLSPRTHRSRAVRVSDAGRAVPAFRPAALANLLAAALATSLLAVSAGCRAEPGPRPSRQVKDFDTPRAHRARARTLDAGAPSASRLASIAELVDADVEQAQPALAQLVRDADEPVRRSAAEWLAILRDPVGLDVQARCLQDSRCLRRHIAARLLGASEDPRYAPLLAQQVRRILDTDYRDGVWNGSNEKRALLLYATIGLARLGRAEDRNLILDAVDRRPSDDPAFLEALGYVDDARSREILWRAHEKLQHTPSCEEAGLGVPALLPLSRLGEPLAIQRLKDILRGIGTPPDPAPANALPIPCADRAQAFDGLRAQDAARFAETVFEIAAREPEGTGTREAWRALAIMHPREMGDRVLALVISKPHWQSVPHDVLCRVILAINPDLHDAFWDAYPNVAVVPLQRGYRSLVQRGLGRLMFTGTYYWTGD